jgi:hypothetical protein
MILDLASYNGLFSIVFLIFNPAPQVNLKLKSNVLKEKILYDSVDITD